MHYDIKPNIFVKSGGIARIAMTISVQQDGGLSEKKIEFQADSCTGVSLVSNALSFSCEMLQEEKKLADLDNTTFLPEGVVATAADNAPAAEQPAEAPA